MSTATVTRLNPARLALYAKFVRVYIVDGPLAMSVGLVAALAQVPPSLEALAKGAWMLGLGTLLFYLVHCLDDITGFKTGTDRATAARKARIGEPKLLASGDISLAEARAIAKVLAAASSFLLLGVVWTAPWYVSLTAVAAIIVTGQYSYAAKWSYRGLGELTVVLNFACCVVMPYLYITETLSWELVAIALEYGLFVVVITFSSNLADMEEDAATGRRSLCVLLGHRRVTRLLYALLVMIWASVILLVLSGTLPWFAAALLLLLPVHVDAARAFSRGEAQRARAAAFTAARRNGLGLIGCILSSALGA